jgi:hypothetical protein
MTSAFLLVPSAFGLLAGFLAVRAFFADFAFLALRAPSSPGFQLPACWRSQNRCSFCLSPFAASWLRFVTVITLDRRNGKQNLAEIGSMRRKSIMVKGQNWRVRSLF